MRVDATSSRKLTNVQPDMFGAGSGDAMAAVGRSSKRALQSSTVRSFRINVTFINSINLEWGTTFDITFDGSSGPVGTLTVTAPTPGETVFIYEYIDAAGESEITADSDKEETVLIIDIETNVCPYAMDVCYDPHLQGLRGEHIEWAGVNGGWYALVKDDEDDLHMNVRTTAPMFEAFLDRQFITGMTVLPQGHSVVIEVKEPYTVETPGCFNKVSPCLANGGLTFAVDDEVVDFLTDPAKDVHLPGGVEVSSSNLPLECREFGGRKVWTRMRKDRLRGRRQLATAKSFQDWILSFTHMVSHEFCTAFVADSDLSKVKCGHIFLRIVTPTAVVRLSTGINSHAGKTDHFGRNIHELDFWQMGVGVEGLSVDHERLSGLLGETVRVVVDPEGNEVTGGAGALPGTVEDYRVSDAEGTNFDLVQHNEGR